MPITALIHLEVAVVSYYRCYCHYTPLYDVFAILTIIIIITTVILLHIFIYIDYSLQNCVSILRSDHCRLCSC